MKINGNDCVKNEDFGIILSKINQFDSFMKTIVSILTEQVSFSRPFCQSVILKRLIFSENMSFRASWQGYC